MNHSTENTEAATYWICPWCHVANFRDFEGLDQCVHCGSETRTRYSGFSDRLTVILAREPAPENRHLCTGRKREPQSD